MWMRRAAADTDPVYSSPAELRPHAPITLALTPQHFNELSHRQPVHLHNLLRLPFPRRVRRTSASFIDDVTPGLLFLTLSLWSHLGCCLPPPSGRMSGDDVGDSPPGRGQRSEVTVSICGPVRPVFFPFFFKRSKVSSTQGANLDLSFFFFLSFSPPSSGVQSYCAMFDSQVTPDR